ncbi:MAG: flagellar export chaperone FliS [Campylobacterales bacterium]|nr:flagellar export chaperone FliS [Campylobacterales bacterium]
MNAVAYNAYVQNNVGIESPEKLIEMLYEGVLRFNVQAIRAIRAEDIEKRTYWINRSMAIFVELIRTLDLSQGDIAHYLSGLYNYQIKLLMEANSFNQSDKLEEVNRVIRGLLEAWRETTGVGQ